MQRNIELGADQVLVPAVFHPYEACTPRDQRTLAHIPPSRFLAFDIVEDAITYAMIPDLTKVADLRRVHLPAPAVDGITRASCLVHRDGVHVVAVRSSREPDPTSAGLLRTMFMDPMPGFISGLSTFDDVDHLVVTMGGMTEVHRLSDDAVGQRISHLTAVGDLLIGIRHVGNAMFVNTFFGESLVKMLATATNPDEILLDDMGVEMPVDIASNDLFMGRPIVTRKGNVIFPLVADNETARIGRVVMRPKTPPHIQIGPPLETNGFRPIGLLNPSMNAPFISTKGRIGVTNALTLVSADHQTSHFIADFYRAFETM